MARRSHDLGGAKTFLAIDDGGDKTILGFYSLSPASIEYARTPEIIRRGLARLAVDLKVQGQASADSFCSRREDAACWRRPKLEASPFSSMPRTTERQSGMRGTVLCRWRMRPLSLLLSLVTIEAALK